MTTKNSVQSLGSKALTAWLARQDEDRKTIAREWGVSASTLTRWANGNVAPSDAGKVRIRTLTGGEVHPMLWLESA